MLKKLTQIEDEMDECLMSVDADNVDVADAASGLRRTFSENVRGKSAGGLDGSDGCRSTVATSKSDQTLSGHCGRKTTQYVAGGTRRDTMTSGIQLTDDDDAADGGVFPDVFPAVATAPVVITPPDDPQQLSYCPIDVPEFGTPATVNLGSPGNYVMGLARSTSDVTSQRRFHRRRSAANCLTGLVPVSGLSETAARHGHSCFAIGDAHHCDAAEPGSSNCSPKPEVNEQQLVLDELDIRRSRQRRTYGVNCTPARSVRG